MTIKAASRSAPPKKKGGGVWRRFAPRLRLTLLAVLLLCLPVASGNGQILLENGDQLTPKERLSLAETEIKAGHLRNFLRYVDWPQTAFKNPQAPNVICVVGDKPLGEFLYDKREAWTIKGRPLEVMRLVDAADVATGGCHIVYLGDSERRRQAEILRLLEGQPVLTVSGARNFCRSGGGIRLRLERDEVDFDLQRFNTRFQVNRDAIRDAGLKVDSAMLELAEKTILNGRERVKKPKRNDTVRPKG